jgi:hypothetical protein
MFNGKFTITLIAMFACLIALFSPEFRHVTENFIHGTRRHETSPDKSGFGPWGGSSQFISVGHNVVGKKSHPRLGNTDNECEFPTGMSTKRNMSPSVSPRFNASGVPKMARYAPPPVQVMANDRSKPIDLITAPLRSKPAEKKASSIESYESAQVSLPQDMSTINVLGTETQPVVYDRLVFSNARSRLRGHGDYIRGDIKITPDSHKDHCGSGWFQVSVKPERDLNPGAMEHLFGRSEELSLTVAQGDLAVPTYGV